MKPEWTVTVVDRGRDTLILRGRNRITGRIKEKKSETTKRKLAEREAGDWASELNRVGLVDDVRFDAAAERFDNEYAIHRRGSTQSKFRSTFATFQKLVGCPFIRAVNESMLAEFCRQYGKGKSAASLASALRHLKVFLRWCNRQKLLPNLPHIEMPKNASKAGGRAITGEEFDRMVAAVPSIRPNDAPQFQFLLRGLWNSGLRLSEALALSWDETDPVCIVDIDSDRPSLRIGAQQKGGKETLTPCPPEFVKLLRTVPAPERHGRVFKLVVRQRERASAIIGRIGRKANLAATAHDLRRSFACRWAKKLPAQALRQLMRHSSIATTLTFYATDDCGLADAIWERNGDKTGDSKSESDTVLQRN